jgi:hypothetical protein
MSEKARPIQSAELSELRFSNRKMAIFWNGGLAGWREHEQTISALKSKAVAGGQWPVAGGLVRRVRGFTGHRPLATGHRF